MCLIKVSLASSLVLSSLWNKQSLIFWSISFTHICQCRWRVLRPCSLSAPANAITVPNMPFPLDDCVLVSHLSKHSVNICMTFWNSNEQAPGFFILASLRNKKSARQSSSEHFKDGRSCLMKKGNSRCNVLVHQWKRFCTCKMVDKIIRVWVFLINFVHSPNFEVWCTVSLWNCTHHLVL